MRYPIKSICHCKNSPIGKEKPNLTKDEKFNFGINGHQNHPTPLDIPLQSISWVKMIG